MSSIKYPAIRQLFASRLQAALNLYISDSAIQTSLKSQIPLHQAKDQQQVLYICAIAFQLSPVLNLPAMEIASTLAQLVRSHTTEQDFTIRVVPPGWMHLELTEAYLAAWLQHLVQAPPQLGRSTTHNPPQELAREQGCRGVSSPSSPSSSSSPPSSPSPTSPHTGLRPAALTYLTPQRQFAQVGNPAHATGSTSHLFTVQYSHARCCSLMQLAHQEGLITLAPTNSPTSSALWLAVEPNPIPWLNWEQKLCLRHLAEQALIAKLIALLDDFYCQCGSGQSTSWHKTALTLSQTFQTFYSYCRIWGEVKSQNIQLAQARLGLVLITQSVLRILLQDHLGIVAPQEL